MKNFIAYKGDEFVIEWYYNAKGESPALEYYQELSQGQKAKLGFSFSDAWRYR